jgi:hypothetical protein
VITTVIAALMGIAAFVMEARVIGVMTVMAWDNNHRKL